MRRKIPPPRINNIKKTVPLCNNFPASPVYLIESAFKNKFSYEQKQNKTMKKFVFTLLLVFVCHLGEGGNLAASKIRNLECPSYEICLIDYGCGKFNRKIHIMEQYP